MDILIHILLIVLIGGFFFIDKYSTSFNPMMFVIILSVIGFVFMQASSVDYVNTSIVNKINSTSWGFETTNLNDYGLGIFTVQSFMVLTYWFFFLLGILNLILGKKESNNRK